MSYSTLEEIFREEGLNSPLQDTFELIEWTRKGITKKYLVKLAGLLSLSLKDFSELLPVSETTIRRYTPNERFNRGISGQIIIITEVILKGLEVFDSQEKLNEWLKSSNSRFGNTDPIKLLDTGFGAQLVKDELERMEHGNYS